MGTLYGPEIYDFWSRPQSGVSLKFRKLVNDYSSKVAAIGRVVGIGVVIFQYRPLELLLVSEAVAFCVTETQKFHGLQEAFLEPGSGFWNSRVKQTWKPMEIAEPTSRIWGTSEKNCKIGQC